MDDPEIEAIRNARLQQMQQQQFVSALQVRISFWLNLIHFGSGSEISRENGTAKGGTKSNEEFYARSAS